MLSLYRKKKPSINSVPAKARPSTSVVEYTVDELAERLEMSQRTIYRYIDSFREAGFSVEKVRDYVYRLTTVREGVADLSDIVYFSPEEAYIVNRLIDGLDAWADGRATPGRSSSLSTPFARRRSSTCTDTPHPAPARPRTTGSSPFPSPRIMPVSGPLTWPTASTSASKLRASRRSK